jgi:NAD+ synthase (glutamine-hydrolysing)
VAASLQGVFSCNSNKTELTVGYGTLYGDAAGFLAPIGDLWKSEVYQIARYLNDQHAAGGPPSDWFSEPPIPEDSLSVVPSAELSEEQDVMQGKGDPFCYPYHDRLFRLWIEAWQRHDLFTTIEAYDAGTLVDELGIPPAQLPPLFAHRTTFVRDCTRWWDLYNGLAAFKRVQCPPVLSISRRALGFDHRECIGLPREPRVNSNPECPNHT